LFDEDKQTTNTTKNNQLLTTNVADYKH